METPRVIAEIGCNHKGDIEIAREMIGIAATFAKCDFVKFQKRSNRELLTPQEYNAGHPNPQNSYGDSYGAHREFLEFDVGQHRQLQQWCQEFGIGYSTSVWDLTSAKEIASLNPEFIKIPSACNLNFPMLAYLATDYGGDIHISVGMTTSVEQEQIVQWMERHGAAERVVLYACTSGYPVPFEQVCLLEIQSLKDRFGGNYIQFDTDFGLNVQRSPAARKTASASSLLDNDLSRAHHSGAQIKPSRVIKPAE